ncbi:MAG: polyphosphate--glucose phosphotransferase, partial [Acidimicrobiia bacterium]
MQRLGIDIGGSGIKGAPVDLDAGEFARDRLRIPTPEGGKPADVARVVAEIVAHFPDVDGPVGCTFPAVMSNGIALTAANVDDTWIGTDAQALFEQQAGRTFNVVNDADAAGIAEMRYGAGKGEKGVVLMLTLGTGIGSALFVDGVLVPNTEFGHLEVHGKKAEHLAAESVREAHDLTWKEWAERLDEVIAAIDEVLWPQLITIGGGV